MGTFFSQFAEPHGKTGYLAGWFMSKENKTINKWTINFLDIQDGDHVLEIGFGSGQAMKYMLNQGKNILITGMDPSEVMVYQALRRLNKRLNNGRIRLIEGKAGNMPRFPQKIDKVLVINNVTFWGQPVGTLEKIRDQMTNGGKIALTVRPHEKGASDETSELIGGQLTALLTHAGFNDVEFFLKPTKPNDTVCALGTK